MSDDGARHTRTRGPVQLRGGEPDPAQQGTTTDQRLLDSRGPSDWVHADPWRVLRIQAEFVEGFGLLAELPRAVSVFGSARTKPDDPYYAAGVELGAALAEAGYAVITGGGPGRDGGGQQGRLRGRRHVGRAGHRAAVRAGAQRVGRRRHRVPLLLRAQDDVREVRPGVRHPARRLRHPRRAVRGAHPGADHQGHPVPGDPVRLGLLVGPAGLDPRHAGRARHGLRRGPRPDHGDRRRRRGRPGDPGRRGRPRAPPGRSPAGPAPVEG